MQTFKNKGKLSFHHHNVNVNARVIQLQINENAIFQMKRVAFRFPAPLRIDTRTHSRHPRTHIMSLPCVRRRTVEEEEVEELYGKAPTLG